MITNFSLHPKGIQSGTKGTRNYLSGEAVKIQDKTDKLKEESQKVRTFPMFLLIPLSSML